MDVLKSFRGCLLCTGLLVLASLTGCGGGGGDAPVGAANDAAPADATNDAAPADATNDAAPADATNDAAPADATNDAAPADATNNAAPADATNNVVFGVSTVSGVTDTATGSSGAGGSSPEPVAVEIIDTIVTWGAPTARENGDFLREVDLLSYRVYYGLTMGDYQDRIDVVSSAEPQVDLIDLPSGIYFLVITSVDIDGRESLYSEEFTVTL